MRKLTSILRHEVRGRTPLTNKKKSKNFMRVKKIKKGKASNEVTEKENRFFFALGHFKIREKMAILKSFRKLLSPFPSLTMYKCQDLKKEIKIICYVNLFIGRSSQ